MTPQGGYSVKARFVAQTDVGLKRKENEDSYLVDEANRVFIVADGMGGHAAGDLASRVAVESMCDYFRRSQTATGPQAAPFGENPDLSEMGNKISNANGRTVTVGNVGDSRGYLFRQSGYRQLTEDHSWVNEQLQKNLITPEDARVHPWRNVITRALGSRDNMEVDIFEERVRGGDQVLLCTDGLSGLLDDITMFEIITDSESTQEQKGDRLIEEAKKAGGHDNITLLLIEFIEDE